MVNCTGIARKDFEHIFLCRDGLRLHTALERHVSERRRALVDTDVTRLEYDSKRRARAFVINMFVQSVCAHSNNVCA